MTRDDFNKLKEQMTPHDLTNLLLFKILDALNDHICKIDSIKEYTDEMFARMASKHEERVNNGYSSTVRADVKPQKDECEHEWETVTTLEGGYFKCEKCGRGCK